jgi:cyclic pyranopterin phosphate synthase
MIKAKRRYLSDIAMADTSEKIITKRVAMATGRIYLKARTLKCIKENKIPKGDVLACAKVAGIMAAKKTHDLIPLCHPLEITNVKVDFKIKKIHIDIFCEVSCLGRTGVEMEALVASAISALTIYDMCKPLDKDMVISDIKLLKKTGGKSDYSLLGR